jgi:hypothetical protein
MFRSNELIEEKLIFSYIKINLNLTNAELL